MRNKSLFIVLSALLLVAGSAYASHSWGKYHWNISTEESLINPLVLGDALTTLDWQVSLGIAAADWNKSVLKNAVTTTTNTNCNPVLGTVQVCNAAYGENDWLGIAQIWAYRGKDSHIAQALTKMNDTYFAMPEYDSQAWRDFVMCQEVGHTLGLDHQDENFENANLGTCMDYTGDPDGALLGQLDNRRPNAHDYEMLSSIYDHVNNPSTKPGNGKGKPANRGTNIDIDLNDSAAWGMAVRHYARGNASLYERDLGNGIVLLTHVFWAL